MFIPHRDWLEFEFFTIKNSGSVLVQQLFIKGGILKADDDLPLLDLHA